MVQNDSRSKARNLLSPTLFNIFLERIMSDALKEHDGKVSLGGRNMTNLRFADDIDALAEEEQELDALIESLDKTRYKMEISAEKTKLMTNSANGIQSEIKVKRQKLGTVTSFKYLGAVVSDDGSKPEVLSRIAQTAVIVLLFYVHGKHLRSCRDVQLTTSHFSWAGLDLLSGRPVLRAHAFASN